MNTCRWFAALALVGVAACGDSKAGAGDTTDAGADVGVRDTGERDTSAPDVVGEDARPVRDIVEVDVPAELPPIAAAGMDIASVPGVPIRFDGGGSTDPDGQVVWWEWNMGNGVSLQGAVVDYTYPDPGVFTVTLTVRDDDGLEGQDTLIVDLQEANNAPTGVIDGPFEVVAGEENEWDARNSSDDIAVVRWSWETGVEDEPAVEGQILEYTYEAWGTYTMTLTVEDTDGVQDLDARSIDVLAPPVPELTGPSQAFVGEEVRFDGTPSYDPDADLDAPTNGIVRWTWYWDDGSPALVGPPFGTHTYAVPGSYDVYVVVEDADGIERASATRKLDVFDIPNVDPTPVISAASYTIDECEDLTLDASLSIDDSDAASELVYIWEFGDGGSLSGQTVDHAWTRDGAYTVTLTALDTEGGSGDTSAIVTVLNIPPTPSIEGPTTALVGEVVTLDGSASTDACEGSVEGYQWSWGDGETGFARPTPLGQHTYAEPGTYDVTLTVYDDGNTVAQASVQHRIEVGIDLPPAPVASANAYTVAECETVLFDATLTTDDRDPLSDLQFLWDFGDGTVLSGPSPSHSYTEPGVYEVELTAIDTASQPNATSFLITVENIAPTAVINAPDDVVIGTALNVSGGDSFDGCEGEIVRYRWDWGDGVLSSGTTSPTASHVYDALGTYVVRLTVTDDADPALTDTAEVRVNVVEATGGPVRYVANPTIAHQCGGGNVNVRLASATIVDAGGNTVVEATGEQPGNMDESRCGGGATCAGESSYDACVCASQVAAGDGCNEFYEMALSIGAPGTFDFVFQANFVENDTSGLCSFLPGGCCLGCTSYSTSGTFLPE